MRSALRALTFYRIVAVMALNAVILFAAVELIASGVIAALSMRIVSAWVTTVSGRAIDVVSYYEALPYYSQQSWATQYWKEFRAAVTQKYQPYVTWRSAPFQGRTIVIGADGVRQTPGADCSPGALTVFAFGGSAMWGWGAPDWATIPAYLQQGLQARRRAPVCVVNFAENAYVSTQSLIQLELVLASGRVPDIVIMYDGVNDVLAASQTGEPVLHQNYTEISARFEGARHPLLAWLQEFRSYELLRGAVGRLTAAPEAEAPRHTDPEALARRVVDAYLNTYKTVAALAGAYGFDYHFFWQPHIVVGSKRLTQGEQRVITELGVVLRVDSALTDLFKATYGRIAREASRFERFYYVGNAFDAVEASIWIDPWGHVTPDGNRLIAGLILEVIEGAGK